MDIEKLRILCNNKRLIITQHCIKRMMERSIELTEIKQAIAEGEVIEEKLSSGEFSARTGRQAPELSQGKSTPKCRQRRRNCNGVSSQLRFRHF